MVRLRANDQIVENLEDAVGELVRMSTRPSQEILDMYAGKQGNGQSDEVHVPALPSTVVSFDAAQLIEAHRQHTKAMCDLVRGQLNALKHMIAGLETKLDGLESHNNESGSMLIECANQIMTVAPEVKLQLNQLGTAIRASGD